MIEDIKSIFQRIISNKNLSIRDLIRTSLVDDLVYFLIDPKVVDSKVFSIDGYAIQKFTRSYPSKDISINEILENRKCICYAVQNNDLYVHKSWVYFDTLILRKIGSPSRNPIIGDCFTDPNFRGNHLYPQVLAHIIGDIFTNYQIDHLFILVSTKNTPSIKGIERAGFKFHSLLQGKKVFGIFFPQKSRSH
jgi:hypothetical protein